MHKAPEIDLNKRVIEVPDRDLWGNPIESALFPKKHIVSRIKKRASIMGGPAGETCGTCRHLVSHSTQPKKRFFKCGLAWNGKHSAASDIRKKHPACADWKPQKTNS